MTDEITPADTTEAAEKSVREALALLSSMVESGEQHTFKSADKVRAGFDALEFLTAAARRTEQAETDVPGSPPLVERLQMNVRALYTQRRKAEKERDAALARVRDLEQALQSIVDLRVLSPASQIARAALKENS